MFRLALINLGFIAFSAIPLLLPQAFTGMAALQFGISLVGVLWSFVYSAAVALSLRKISDYHDFGFKDFFANLKKGWKQGLAYGAISFIVLLIATTALPFYIQVNSFIGVFLASVIFWVLIVAALSLQFYLPVISRLDSNILKGLKKSFIIFRDNPFFSICCAVFSLGMTALSLLLAFLIPGPAGVLLFLDEALRLRLLKYDYLEENPNADRRHIPWDAILIDEREKTGTRTLRNFIFPWKD
jgi:uncharacterized membrane protein YesL